MLDETTIARNVEIKGTEPTPIPVIVQCQVQSQHSEHNYGAPIPPHAANLLQEINSLREANSQLQQQMRAKQKQFLKKRREVYHLSKRKTAVEEQLRKLEKKQRFNPASEAVQGTSNFFSDKSRQIAKDVYRLSPSAYRALLKHMPHLPQPRTVQRWLRDLRASEGYLNKHTTENSEPAGEQFEICALGLEEMDLNFPEEITVANGTHHMDYHIDE